MLEEGVNKLLKGLKAVSTNYKDSHWWTERFLDQINGPFQTKVYPGRSGVDIMDADWDILIVCDACRADTFESVVDLNEFDEYRREISQASQTGEWLVTNFADGNYGDTVYVAGSPMISKWVPKQWHELIEAWREGYDPDFAQVHAEVITDHAIDAIKEYPNKRIIIHYMQPHAPFVNYPDLHYSAWDGFEELKGGIEPIEKGPASVWHAAANGLVDSEYVWKAYTDNLEYVMPEVKRVLDNLSSGTKAVVTSDHGNIIKSYSYPVPLPISGHPRYHRHPGLVTVPWAEVTIGRRRVVDSKATSRSAAEDQEVSDRLKSLGYKK